MFIYSEQYIIYRKGDDFMGEDNEKNISNDANEFMRSIPTIKPLHLILIGMFLTSFVLFAFVSVIEHRTRQEILIVKMTQCMEYLGNYEDCKFHVYGGFRINLNSSKNPPTEPNPIPVNRENSVPE